MKLKETKNGNTIVPIIKGHLVIPITNKKYELFSSYDMEITKKDFEEIEGEWDDVFKRLYGNKLTKQELMLLNFYLPDAVYNKFKKTESKLFKETDFMKICVINVLKDYPKKGEITLNVNFDLLKEYKKTGRRSRKNHN